MVGPESDPEIDHPILISLWSIISPNSPDMSMLRLLASSKDPYGPSKPGSSSKNTNTPSLVLDIPAYGAVFMNTPEDPLVPLDQQDSIRNDVIVHGELVINMPPNIGRRRVKKIKVGIRSVVRLDLKPGRMNEEDEFFSTEIEIKESETCQCWLNEGSSIFDFTLIIPANHPPHDWHNNGTVRHFLYAEIQGSPKVNPGFLSFRSRSHGPGSKSPGHRSPRTPGSPSRSRSNSPAPPRNIDAALLEALTLDSTPAYEKESKNSSESSSPTPEEDWLKGSYKTERTLMLIYNPSPTGEVNVLNLRFNGVAEQLGIWEIKLEANPVGVYSNPSVPADRSGQSVQCFIAIST